MNHKFVNGLAHEVGMAAYLACLKAGKDKHWTRRFGFPRAAYAHEYAQAAQIAAEREVYRLFALGEKISPMLDRAQRHLEAAASRIEAQRGETPKSGSISEADESLTAESGDAHTQAPRECK